MPGRNDPCPCGSGKKYKNCHQREDESAPRALRVIRGGLDAREAARSRGVPIPADAVVPSDYWEADLLPFAAELADDPTARTTILMLGAGEHVLSAEVLAHPPSEAHEVAALLAEKVAEACLSTGVRPVVVLVRLETLIDELAERFADPEHPAHGAKVSASRTLVRLDQALGDLESHAGLPRDVPGNLLSSLPRSWAAWGFAHEDVREFFEACAAFYRAAPWDVLQDNDPFTVRPRDGGSWEAIVMGHLGEAYGMSLYADAMDLMRVFDGPEGDPAAYARIRQAVLSLVFEPRDAIAKPMRDEIKLNKWPVAGPMAYPTLTAVNTPGAGITTRQLRSLTAALRAVPGFVEKYGKTITGEEEGRFPLRYTDRATGASIEMLDVI